MNGLVGSYFVVWVAVASALASSSAEILLPQPMIMVAKKEAICFNELMVTNVSDGSCHKADQN